MTLIYFIYFLYICPRQNYDTMTVAIGNDHAGVSYKFEILKHLTQKGIEVLNYGTDTSESVDYPDRIHPVALAVTSQKARFGIILCGSGNGAQITANKHKNIRAALCWEESIVSLARQHNDANILSIPARFVSLPQAIKFVDIFLSTNFQAGRHQNRINKINC